MNINREIEKYTIHIEFNDNNGSGVLFKPYEDSEYCYIFTAKHNFEIEDEDNEKKFYSPIDNIDKFKIRTVPFRGLKIDSIVKMENEDIDFLILSISKNNNQSLWSKIAVLKIFNGEIFQNSDFKISGFPAINNHKKSEIYPCKIVNNKNYITTFEVQKTLSTYETNELETNQGISGGGAFIEGNNDKVYLVGIEVEYEPIQKLKCIDLREIIDEINKKVPNRVEMGGHPILDKYDLMDKSFDLSFIEEKLKNDYIMAIKDKPIEFVIDKNEPINKKLDNEYKALIERMKDMANSYLYRGAILNEKDNHLATINFKRAIELNKDLEIYLAMAKYIRNRDNYKKIDNEIKRENQINIDILKSKIEEEKDIDELKKLHISLLFYLEKYKEYYKEDIALYKKKLIEIYIKTLDFKEAERILENKELNEFLTKEYIRDRLFKIYFHKDYLNITQLSKKEFAKKLIDLLGRFDFESKEYSFIRKKLEELSLFDDFIFDLQEKLIKSDRTFAIYEKNIVDLSQEIKRLKKNSSFYHKDNRFLHFSIYLIVLLIIFNHDEILKGINIFINYIKELDFFRYLYKQIL